MNTIGEWWMWVGFFIFVGIMLFIDMFVLGGRKAHRVSNKEALGWSVAWLLLAFVFNFLFWWYVGSKYGYTIANQNSLEFFAGYLLEKSLSVENIFVFVLIVSYFSVPVEYQRRVLLYGVLGAIIMRLFLILLGILAINQFSWIFYIFGVFLSAAALKMLIVADQKPDLSRNIGLHWVRKHLRITEQYHDQRFFMKVNDLNYVTPLFVVLVLIQITNLIFAVDSIPTIFAITSDPFIVVTSNVFAILGLRELYFLLANMIDRFHFLKYGLNLILIFIGIKMLLLNWFKISIGTTLIVILSFLLGSVFLSFYRTKNRVNRV